MMRPRFYLNVMVKKGVKGKEIELDSTIMGNLNLFTDSDGENPLIAFPTAGLKLSAKISKKGGKSLSCTVVGNDGKANVMLKGWTMHFLGLPRP